MFVIISAQTHSLKRSHLHKHTHKCSLKLTRHMELYLNANVQVCLCGTTFLSMYSCVLTCKCVCVCVCVYMCLSIKQYQQLNALSFSQFIERSGNKTALFLATFKNMTKENVKYKFQHFVVGFVFKQIYEKDRHTDTYIHTIHTLTCKYFIATHTSLALHTCKLYVCTNVYMYVLFVYVQLYSP